MPRIDRPSTPAIKPSVDRPVRPSAEPASTGTVGWAPQTGGAGRRATTSSASATAATVAVSHVNRAVALGATDALKAIKNGDVEINVPVKAGELLPGKLTAKENTVVRMSLHVKDGNIDFARSKLKIDPGLDGPLGTSLEGVTLRPDGRAEVDIDGLPNPVVGNPSPAKLADFVDSLQTAESLPVKVLGLTVANVNNRLGGGASTSSASGPGGAQGKSHSAQLLEKIDFSRASVSVKNVQFNDGVVPLAGAGKLKLSPDTKLSIEGSLSDLTLKGRASVSELDLDVGGTSVRGGRGSADVDVRWSGDPRTQGTVTTKISNLNLAADYAVSKRENGDFLELARGKVQNASLSFTQDVGPGGPLGKPNAELKIGHFEGVVNGGQITVPDGDGTATIKLGKSTVKGQVEVTPQRVMVSGDIELDARVTNLDTPDAKVRLSFSDVHVKGKARAQFDSASGLEVNGNLKVKAQLENGSLDVKNQKTEFTKSTLDVTATHVSVGPGGAFDLQGKATVDVGFKNLEAGDKGVKLKGGSGRVSGTADVRVSDTDGVQLSNGNLNLKASVEDGRLQLSDDLSLDFKAGTRLESALKTAVFDRKGVALDLSRTKLDATLDEGSVRLPTGQQIAFKSGAQLAFTLDRLDLPQKGIPEARGSLELTAGITADQIDTRSLVNLPGVSLSTVEGVDTSFKLRLGRFSIKKDGQFELNDLRYGIEANIRRIGGRIE